MVPGDYMEDCSHAEACRMQWERAHGVYDDSLFDATDELAVMLECGDGCKSFTDSYNVPMSLCALMRGVRGTENSRRGR